MESNKDKYSQEFFDDLKRQKELQSGRINWQTIKGDLEKKYRVKISSVDNLRKMYFNHFGLPSQEPDDLPTSINGDESWRESRNRDTWIVESTDSRIRTVDDVIKKAGVDLAIWEVAEVKVGAWDTTMKLRTGTDNKGKEEAFRSQNQLMRVKFRRKVTESIEQAVERLLDRIRKVAPKAKQIHTKPVKKLPHRHSLEICLMDPHYGMRCFKPGADADWSPELCANMVTDSLNEILALAKPYAPFEQVVLPIGNDFFHSDSIWQTTTAGTPQPEADAYYHTFIGGEQLMIEVVDKVKELAPVILYSIPGNHDRTTSFMLGRILKAYYSQDKNVTVHADESPYKFHRYGVNLIGYEHGHSVAQIRLAALMANECPEDWLATKHGYREWHLGDQHRKGSGKPSLMEEQGVSVEFLPSITAPNEWHRLKAFNWQKRGTMAFVWHHDAGPIARLQVNVDRYLNTLMGRSA